MITVDINPADGLAGGIKRWGVGSGGDTATSEL